MKLYIIFKDGKPYITDRDNKPYVKAYYDESLAKKTAKSFCTTEANMYYAYGGGYFQLQAEGYVYPEVLDERKKRSKELAKELMKCWEVREVEI